MPFADDNQHYIAVSKDWLQRKQQKKSVYGQGHVVLSHTQNHKYRPPLTVEEQGFLVVLGVNLEVSLWMSACWADLRSLCANYDVTTVAALPYLHLALLEHLSSLDVLE